MDKQPKAKEKAKKPPPGKAKTVKGKTPINEDKFRGNGISFKGKLVGISEVNGPRGDNMCITAIRKLKLHALKMNKEIGEHKQKIVMNINLKGVHLIDEKTQLVVHDHLINKVSYITHDPEDKRTFGYIVSVPGCTTGHQLFALKTEKPASTVTAILYELFQVVYKLRQEAQKLKTTSSTTPVKTAASVSENGAAPGTDGTGIYEEPAKCTPPQSKKPVTPHYKIPARSQGALQPVPQRPDTESPGQLKKDEDTDSTNQADRLQYETPTFDAKPIFGDSFIAEAERKNSVLSESGSVSSANVFRNDSISSSSSDATSQPGEHFRTAVFSPTADSFPSSSEGTPTTSIQQNLSFDTSFPPVPSTNEKKESASDKSTDNHSFSDTFSSDSNFGNTTENQSLQTNFPDDSAFGFQGFAASEPFKAVFPDDSNFGSKLEPVTGDFASFEAAFPADSFSDNQPFDSSFSTDSSSTTMKQTASVDLQNSSTDVDSSLSKDVKEKHSSHSIVSGATSEGNKPDEPKFKNASSDAQVNDTDNSRSQDLDDAFKSTVISEFKNEVPTIDLVNKSEPFEGSKQGSISASNTNEVNVDVNQAEEDSGNNQKGDVKQSDKEVDSVSPPESFAFKADFGSFPPTSEMSNSSAVKLVTNFDEAFPSVATQELDRNSMELTKDVSSMKNDFDSSNAFENLQKPNVKSPETIKALFSNSDLFSVSDEDSKMSSSDSVDPFVASQEVHASDTPTFVTTFEEDSFFSTPFEFKDNTQSETVDTVINSENTSKGFAWQDAFGNDSTATSKSVSAIETNVTALDQQSSIPDVTKVTTSPEDVSKKDNPLTIDSRNDKNGHSSNKQDPFCEFEVDFDTFVDSTTDPACNGTENGEKEEQQDATVKLELHSTVVSNDVSENLERGASVKEKPTQLDFFSDNPENHSLRSISPNAPPPLPPRPVMTLPSLPPRPIQFPDKSIDVPMSELETPPIPPFPQTGQARKLPPALPPRIDLQSRHEQKVDLFTGNDPFGVESTEGTDNSISAWGSSWPSAVDGGDSSKQINDQPDTFGNDFFQAFEFGENTAMESTSTPVKTASTVADPFASTSATDPFGSDDLFSQSPFTSSKSTRSSSIKNVFGASLSESFGTEPTNDPFSDISDPFAGKGDISSADPFLGNTENKDIKLQEDPFTDSFA